MRAAVIRSSAADAYGRRKAECVLAACFSRTAFDGVLWNDADAARIVHDASTDLVVKPVGQAKELGPIDLLHEPELAKLIEAVDLNELDHGELPGQETKSLRTIEKESEGLTGERQDELSEASPEPAHRETAVEPAPGVGSPGPLRPSPSASPARWADDPTGRHESRYWDGQQWTEHVLDLGRQTIDPLWPLASEQRRAATTTQSASDVGNERPPASAPWDQPVKSRKRKHDPPPWPT